MDKMWFATITYYIDKNGNKVISGKATDNNGNIKNIPKQQIYSDVFSALCEVLPGNYKIAWFEVKTTPKNMLK